ncbi:MAG TPA: oxidoreductase [Pseudonocardiaceae bacterium]|jgi:protochlorophyllide reductase|nr:oxidoreductase [Pseudonocardiaceae bacterium]
MTAWSEQDMPDQTGRTVLVTGANSGIGLEIARALAGHGARVLLGCRSADRGAAAAREVGGELVLLDLADLSSVRAAAKQVREMTGDRLAALVNNAGVMMTPKLATVDGFESQFGTNHVGHAALTWLLMPALAGGRVVTMSSPVARVGQVDVADPNFEHRRYLPTTAYGQSKLANLLFAFELDRRLRHAGRDVSSIAAHPGYTDTKLIANMAGARNPGPLANVIEFVGGLGNKLIAQSAAAGALPALYATTMPDAHGGEYYGPDGLFELYGHPRLVRPPRLATDSDLAARLWERTAALSGVAPDPE